MAQSRSLSASKWTVRVAAGLAVLNGCFWLVAWMIGTVFQWSAAGVLTAKTNMAVGQILAGLALFVLGSERVNRKVIALGVIAAGCVLLIGGCTLSEHLLGIDFGIDQLLAKESPGAVGTTQPNRMGLPGSTSLTLLGAGLLLLVRHRRLALYPGLLVFLITLVPLVGFLYRVKEFYKLPHLTGIAWSTAVVLMGLGVALVVVDGRTGPMAILRRNDAGGRLLRQWLPIVLLVPIVLGFLRVQGERHGWFDLELGTGTLVLLMVVIFILLLWRTAEQLSRVAQSQAAAEAVLVESEQRYRLLFERNPDGVFVVDTSGRFTVVNPACATISGYSTEELLRKNFMELCAPDQLSKTTEHFKRTLSERAYSQMETVMVRKDGERVELWIAGEPILQHGNVVAVHCTARDTTARTRAERALRQSEEQFRMLADSIPNLAWWAEGDGNSTWFNRRWYEYTGTTPAQMENGGWQSLHDPVILPTVLDRWSRSISSGEPFEMEFPLRAADGQYRWFLTRVIPLRDQDGKLVRWFGTNTDVTDTRQAREVLARSKQEMELLVAERTAKLQELVGELEHFSYTITHDMRAPLRAMKGFAEVIGELLESGQPADARPFVRRIMTAADRMDSLIRDSLNYSRAVRQELTLEPVELGGLLRGMLDSYPELQPSKALIQIKGLLPTVMGNEAALTQCFSNLLGNAVKFVAPGQTPDVSIWAEPANEWVRIYVADHGIGIAECMLPHVFEMFSRGQNTYEGTGIGLALVRKVVQRMGGRVGVESQEGNGSCFWIELKPWTREVIR